MPKCMMLLTSGPTLPEGISPEEIGQTFQALGSWMNEMQSSTRYVSSEKLADEGGKVLTGQGSRLSITDGPYSEAKEVIGGYVMFRAANYEEALAIARECPYLKLGNITVRETDPMGCGGE